MKVPDGGHVTGEDNTITGQYTYDAYGSLTEKTGTTKNSYLYTGESYDATTNLYYLRARYRNPSIGRFQSRDPYPGTLSDPISQHPYLYANADPVNHTDLTGYSSLAELNGVMVIEGTLDSMSSTTYLSILGSLFTTITLTQMAISPKNMMDELFVDPTGGRQEPAC